MRLSPAPLMATVGLAALAPCCCEAQVSPTTVQVSSTGTLNLEPAFIVNPGTPTVRLVVWQQIDSGGAIHYAMSKNGGASWAADTALPAITVPDGSGGECTLIASGDAAVAAVINNGIFDLYAGGIADPGRYVIARMPNGSATLTPIALVGSCGDPSADKGFMTGYPGPGVPASDLMLIGFDIGTPMYSAHSIDITPPVGSSWPQSSGTLGYPSVVPAVPSSHPLGAYPLGIRGGTFNGRVVMGYSPNSGTGLAVAAFSDTGGQSGDWQSFHQFTSCYEQSTNTRFLLSSIGLPGSQPIPGRGPNGENAITILGWPSLSNNPLQTSQVFVAFPAVAEDTPGDVDICIAYSLDGGTTWDPADPNFPQVVRVRDAQLHFANEPAVSDEWMPSVTVDGQGGISIMFVISFNPDSTLYDDTRVQVRCARWPSLSALVAGATPTLVQFSPYPFRPRSGVGSNEYQMLSSSACDVSGAWAAPVGDPLNGDWHVFVSRMALPCLLADVTADGQVTADDAVAFFNAFIAGDPLADVNHDQVLDIQDTTAFIASYSCGCNPH